MRVLSLQAENVKKLTAVEIVPKGDMVVIGGKNAQGKSSVLDAIWMALAGAAAIPGEPIRKGADKAHIRLDLGEIIVKRRFGRQEVTDPETGEVRHEGFTTSVHVETTAGARFPSPQKMLDALLGNLTFDPLAFARMKPADQFAELRKVLNLGTKIDELDAEAKRHFEARTAKNREAKEAAIQAASIAVDMSAVPAAKVDVMALVSALQAAGEHNAAIEQRKARREAAATDIETLLKTAADAEGRIAGERAAIESRYDDLIAEFERQIEELRERIRAAQSERQGALTAHDEMRRQEIDAQRKTAAELREKLDAAPPLPAPIDATIIQAHIAGAEAANALFDLATARKAREAERDAAKAAAEVLTKAIEDCAAKKLAIIAAAKMPVDGLGLGDGVVTFGGIPFDQASSAEQLRVSVAIAMAANPKLRVLRIQDGSLLDEDSMAILAKMCADAGYQAWVEVVRTDGTVGVVIEDGHVKEAQPCLI